MESATGAAVPAKGREAAQRTASAGTDHAAWQPLETEVTTMPRITQKRTSPKRMTAAAVKAQRRRRRKAQPDRSAMIHQDILTGEYLS